MFLFIQAKVAGEQEGKWLMVNIQDSKEFSCQQLNRDVWSNDAVRTILAGHFILWQVQYSLHCTGLKLNRLFSEYHEDLSFQYYFSEMELKCIAYLERRQGFLCGI